MNRILYIHSTQQTYFKFVRRNVEINICYLLFSPFVNIIDEYSAKTTLRLRPFKRICWFHYQSRKFCCIDRNCNVIGYVTVVLLNLTSLWKHALVVSGVAKSMFLSLCCPMVKFNLNLLTIHFSIYAFKIISFFYFLSILWR